MSTVFLLWVVLQSSSPAGRDSVSIPAAPQATAPARPQDDTTIMLLRTQIAVMKEYDQQLLSTIYWSLGGIVSAALVIVTAGWFANFRIYERDRDAQHREVNEILDAKRVALEKGLSDRVEEMKKELDETFEKRIASKTSDLEARIAKLRNGVLRLQYEFQLIEVEKWEQKSVLANVVSACVRAIDVALDVGVHHYEVGSVLDKLSAAIKRCDDEEIDAGSMRDLTVVLDRLPNEYSDAKQRIRSILSRAAT